MNHAECFAGHGSPSEALSANIDKKIYGIIHFGLNTYTGQEWGPGDVSPLLFNPTLFDADQIIRAAADGGLQGIILVCKHHDGFCLWPTSTTNYNISKSPYKDGHGDIVGEFARACKKAGISFGVYVSPWDRNSAFYGTPRYIEIYKEQIREVLTRYGDIYEMWFDGANGGDGYYGGARETRTIDASSYYQWDKLWSLVRSLQPKAAIFSDVGPDRRWAGNERGYLPIDCFCSCDLKPSAESQNPVPCPGNMDLSVLQNGTPGGSLFIMPECDFPLRPRWFYHKEDDNALRPPAKLLDIYLYSVGAGGSMNIGLSPNSDGRLAEQDVICLHDFKKMLSTLFKNSVYSGNVELSEKPSIIELGGKKSFNLLRFSEDIESGERILSYKIDVLKKGQWELLVSGKAVGSCRIRHLRKFESDLLRITAETKDKASVSVKLELFSASEALFADNDKKEQEALLYNAIPAQINGRSVFLDMRSTHDIKKLILVPLGNAKGTPERFKLEESMDGNNWQTVIENGEFSNIRANPIPQEIFLPHGFNANYIRFSALRMLSPESTQIEFVRFEVK